MTWLMRYWHRGFLLGIFLRGMFEDVPWYFDIVGVVVAIGILAAAEWREGVWPFEASVRSTDAEVDDSV